MSQRELVTYFNMFVVCTGYRYFPNKENHFNAFFRFAALGGTGAGAAPQHTDKNPIVFRFEPYI